MNRWIVLGAGALALVGGISVGTAGANAITSNPTQPANHHPRVVANATALDTAVQSTFTAINPCRIVDTRHGHKSISHGHTRAFQVTGSTGFRGQGGTTAGCGVPPAAQSVALSITGLDETGRGSVTLYPNGAARPLARALSFTKGIAATANADAMIGTNGKVDAYVGGHGKTDLLLDVTGYYISPLWAEVSSAGGIVRGSRAVSATHIGTGSYQADFDRDVTNCSYNATSYFYGTTMEVEPRSGDTHAVFIAAADYNGNAVDTYFYLTITC